MWPSWARGAPCSRWRRWSRQSAAWRCYCGLGEGLLSYVSFLAAFGALAVVRQVTDEPLLGVGSELFHEALSAKELADGESRGRLEEACAKANSP